MARILPLLVFLLIAPAAQAAVPGVQAHRGGPVIDGDPLFAEETLPAFRNAHRNLQVVLELDAKLTKDSVPVVFHDDTLDRTTNCTGLVKDKTLAELAECPADVLGAPGNDLKTAPAPDAGSDRDPRGGSRIREERRSDREPGDQELPDRRRPRPDARRSPTG